MAAQPESKASRSRVRLVEGNDLLYHYLQKTLLEEDADQYRLLTSKLVAALRVWLPPAIYQRFPVMVPFAVRDATCRGNRSKGPPGSVGRARRTPAGSVTTTA